MITKEEIYKRAFETKKRELKEKKSRRDMMLVAAYSTEPELKEIDRKLSALGAKAAIEALSGGNITELKRQSETLAGKKRMILSKCGVNEIEYDCPICSDTGYINGKICECVKKLASFLVAEELSREMPLEKSRFDNFDLKYYSDKDCKDGNPRRRMTSILKISREYALKFNPANSPNLLFMGNTGLGKTHITLAIAAEVIEKGYIPVYGAAENLFSLIEKEKFSSENRGAYDAMIKSDLLIIDDLGAEVSTSFAKSALYNLINTRLLSGRPTIINTNLTMKEIEARYTARISSRLIGNYEAYKFIGTDIRQQKALEKISE